MAHVSDGEHRTPEYRMAARQPSSPAGSRGPRSGRRLPLDTARRGAFDIHGNASITMTMDRYGHRMPGSVSEARRACSTPTWTARQDLLERPISQSHWCTYRRMGIWRVPRPGFAERSSPAFGICLKTLTRHSGVSRVRIPPPPLSR
jgi:hypothetical protein